MANTNGFIKMAVGALVVAIVAVGVILPLFSSAEITAGDLVTLTNETSGPYTADYTETDFTMTITPANDDDGYCCYVNSEGFAKPSVAIVGLISDQINIRLASSEGRACEVGWYDSTLGEIKQFNDASETVTVVYDASENTLTYTGSNTATFTDVKFVFTLSNDGKYSEILNASEYPDMCLDKTSIDTNTAGVLFFRNSVTLGDNTVIGFTTASKYGIISYWASDVAADWEVSLEFDGLALKDGYTDIYTGGTPTFVITDGTNTAEVVAQKSYILTDVTGHEASGLTYTIVSILPVIILVGVLMMVVTAFISNRRA